MHLDQRFPSEKYKWVEYDENILWWNNQKLEMHKNKIETIKSQMTAS